VLPHVKAGKLRSLAVLGPARSTALPDVPTMAESGLPGFEVNNWAGLFAPAGTPAAVVGKLNAEIVRIMRLPDVQARLAGEGLRFVPMSVEEFATFARSEVAHWAPVVKASGARAD